MTKEQENELIQHFGLINDHGERVPLGARSWLLLLLENLDRIEGELDRKDRTSKRELRRILKESRRQLFKALNMVK